MFNKTRLTIRHEPRRDIRVTVAMLLFGSTACSFWFSTLSPYTHCKRALNNRAIHDIRRKWPSILHSKKSPSRASHSRDRLYYCKGLSTTDRSILPIPKSRSISSTPPILKTRRKWPSIRPTRSPSRTCRRGWPSPIRCKHVYTHNLSILHITISCRTNWENRRRCTPATNWSRRKWPRIRGCLRRRTNRSRSTTLRRRPIYNSYLNILPRSMGCCTRWQRWQSVLR